MDFVLVFPLIVGFLSTGQSDTKVNSNSCYALCPPGYYKAGDCNDTALKHRCEKCDNTTFTDIENITPKCRRCDSCGHYEIEIKSCSFNGDVICDCKEGYYNASINPNIRNCLPCHCKYCKGSDNPDYKRKCQPCKRCANDTECKRKCRPTTVSPSTNPPTATTTSTAPSTTTTATPSTTPSTTRTVFVTTTATVTRTAASNSTPNPAITQVPLNLNQMSWMFVVWVVVTFPVLFWLLLLFIKNQDCCLYWSANKNLEPPVEDPKFNEQRSHQDSSPTTLTLNVSEETPMMTLSQSPTTPEHPAHIGRVLPDAEHKAASQDEQSEHWPAIVLYAIIKEVPLRRWKEFLRLLSVADQQLERVELEAGLALGSMERQYQMLRLWSQQSSASLNDVFSALHYMDLSGCAQLLQESLERLQWRPELKQGFIDHGFKGAMQDT